MSFLEKPAFPLWDFFHLDHDFGRIETADMSSNSIFPVTRIHVGYFSQLAGCRSQEESPVVDSDAATLELPTLAQQRGAKHWRVLILKSRNVWKNLKQLIDGFEGREKFA